MYLNFNLSPSSGQTALHKAALTKRRSICYMLVAAGASLIIQDNNGRTPKLLALEAEDRELSGYLESEYHTVSCVAGSCDILSSLTTLI